MNFDIIRIYNYHVLESGKTVTCLRCGRKHELDDTGNILQDVMCSHTDDIEVITKANGFKNLKGQVFGNWLVQKYVGDRKWVCECLCNKHTVKIVSAYSLTSGKSTSCGQCNKVTVNIGDTFGKWTVIDNVEGDDTKVKCRCTCNRERIVNKYTLVNGTSTSCGKGHDRNSWNVIDISGQIFGELEVIKWETKRHKWKCKCSCGRITYVTTGKLKTGHTKSCGHLAEDRFDDLTGRRFDMLEVVKYLGNKRYLCRCDCTNLVVEYRSNLLNRLNNKNVSSCGCMTNHFTANDFIEVAEGFKATNGRYPYPNELADAFGISVNTVPYYKSKFNLDKYITLLSNRSRGEQELADVLQDYEIECNNKSIIGREMDIYCESLNLALEYDGLYWHSTKNTNRDNYIHHQDKSYRAFKNGIKLIHVFENEWEDCDKRNIIINMINKDNKKVIARGNVVFDFITSNIAEEFSNKYSLCNYLESDINIGCFDKDTNELLGIMVLGEVLNAEDNDRYQYQIYGHCFKCDIQVEDGTKMMLNFITCELNIKSLVIYNDFSKFQGKTYYECGFRLIAHRNWLTEPCVFYARHNKNRYIDRYNIEDILGDIEELDNKGISVDDAMDALGYYKLYDSGKMVMEWFK